MTVKIDTDKLEWVDCNCFWRGIPNSVSFLDLKEIDPIKRREEIQRRLNEHYTKLKNSNKTSFCGQDLDQPGTIIQLEDSSVHLIGTMPYDLNRTAIVKRYAVLFDWEEFEKNINVS